MQSKEVIEIGKVKLIGTLTNIKELYFEKDLDVTQKELKLQKLNEYFTGVADMMGLMEDKEYHWSTVDKITFSVVTIDNKTGKEETIYTI